jgi:hypothetical protein
MGTDGDRWGQMGKMRSDGDRWGQMGTDGDRWGQMGTDGDRWGQMGTDGDRGKLTRDPSLLSTLPSKHIHC